MKKIVLKNFAKFTGKHLYLRLFFNKVTYFSKKETLAQVFSCEFSEIFKYNFFYGNTFSKPVSQLTEVAFRSRW